MGLAAYVLFHVLLKRPLIALISPRLASFTCAGVPAVPWYAVDASLLVGTLTHIVGRAHAFGRPSVAAAREHPRRQRDSRRVDLAQAAARADAAVVAALWSADIGIAFDRPALRHLLRNAGIAGLEAFGTALVVYCILFQRKML